MSIQSVQPRLVRYLYAPGYLGMDRNKFDAEVRPQDVGKGLVSASA